MKKRNTWFIMKDKFMGCMQIETFGRTVLVGTCVVLALYMFQRVHENPIGDDSFLAVQATEEQVGASEREEKTTERQYGAKASDKEPETQGAGLLEGKINLNEADKELLMEIPYIGAKKANDIIAYRTNRPFVAVEDVMEVKGISQKTFDKIVEFITI